MSEKLFFQWFRNVLWDHVKTIGLYWAFTVCNEHRPKCKRDSGNFGLNELTLSPRQEAVVQKFPPTWARGVPTSWASLSPWKSGRVECSIWSRAQGHHLHRGTRGVWQSTCFILSFRKICLQSPVLLSGKVRCSYHSHLCLCALWNGHREAWASGLDVGPCWMYQERTLEKPYHSHITSPSGKNYMKQLDGVAS